MMLSTTRAFSLVVATFVALSAVTTAVGLIATNSLASRSERVRHTSQVLLGMERLLSDLRDAETGQRGFLLTSRQEYLEPYAVAASRVRTRFQHLRALTSDNPDQQRALDSLLPLVTAKLTEMGQTIDSVRAGQAMGARALVISGEGKRLMDQIRGLAAGMETEEQRLLEERTISEEATGRTGRGLLLLFGGLVAALAAGAVIPIRSDHRRRGQAEAALRQSETEARTLAADLRVKAAELEALFEVIPVGIAIADDPQCRRLRMNSILRRLLDPPTDGREPSVDHGTGQQADYRLERHGRELRPDEAPMQLAVTTGRQVPGTELQAVWPDGRRVTLLVSAAPLVDAGGTVGGAVGAFIDVTQARATEARLGQVQRMEFIGQLAGGVAHEANNQMAVVLGCTAFVLRRGDLPLQVRQDVEQMRRAAERTATVTAQLLAYSRRQFLRPRPLDLNSVIRDLSPVLTRILGEQSNLELRLAAKLGRVRADPGQLEQVLLNLILNSRDGMVGGGTATIETSEVELDERSEAERLEEGNRPGRYARLVVRDTGVGIEPAILPRIFEPFYTTKPVGSGTGLGLAAVYGIVKQSEGYIHARSTVGAGATFEIYLPLLEEEDPTLPEPVGLPALGRDRTFLVVEDEPHVRGVAARALAEQGCTVLEAADGQKALELLASHRGSLDAVVTDLAMPEVGGRTLAERLALSHPGVPILFISGYTDDEVVGRELMHPGAPFLQKPFTPGALVASVAALLVQPGGTGGNTLAGALTKIGR